jgi:hypothetical protein
MGAAARSPSSSTLHEVTFRLTKIADIGFITVVYFMLGFVIGLAVDGVMGPFDPDEAGRKSVARLLLEMMLHAYLLGVIIYVVRNLVERIPSPLDGIGGFEHGKVKELGNAFVFGLVLFWNQKNLVDKMNHTYFRCISRVYPGYAAPVPFLHRPAPAAG